MRRSIATALALLAAAPASAQQRNWDNAEIRAERVAPGVAVLFGVGGNIGLSYGPDGNVLIDDQFAPLTGRILAAVASVNPGPVRFVINTHWHSDHTGGNENLAEGGTVVVAHENVRTRMSVEQLLRGERVAASPAAALPVITFGQGLSFHLNGDEVRVFHVPDSHTDGDSLVYWHRANVLHMGDTYFNGMLPFIDLDSGGSIDGLLSTLLVAIHRADENTVIVPGHGPLATRAELIAYRARLQSMRDRIQSEIDAGRSLDQVKALRLADAYGRDTDFISPDAFVESVYRSLTTEPPHHDGTDDHDHDEGERG
jgi:cyclase